MKSAFLKAGHLPTLIACFLYFDLSFMVWVLLGPMAVLIAQDLNLNPGQKGLMVAVPVLAGALLRIVNGVLVGQLHPRLTGLIMQVIVIAGLIGAWLIDIHSFQQMLMLGVVLGVAGASFAIALPMVSYWYPPEHQGMALGLAGAGNSGTVLASLFVPGLAVCAGLAQCAGPGRAAADRGLCAVLLHRQEQPAMPAAQIPGGLWPHPEIRRCLVVDVLLQHQLRRLCRPVLLPADLFPRQVRPERRSMPATSPRLASSPGRSRGPSAARWPTASAARVRCPLSICWWRAYLFTIARGALSVQATLVLFIIGMSALGMGNGAVFQLVPQRFREDVGLMTGLVGMTGGIGGFYLAASLGYAQQYTGSYAFGFSIFAGMAVVAFLGIMSVRPRWRRESATLAAARI